MLSKFASKIKINKNNYVVLNNLLFNPISMDKEEVEKLFKGDLSDLATKFPVSNLLISSFSLKYFKP